VLITSFYNNMYKEHLRECVCKFIMSNHITCKQIDAFFIGSAKFEARTREKKCEAVLINFLHNRPHTNNFPFSFNMTCFNTEHPNTYIDFFNPKIIMLT